MNLPGHSGDVAIFDAPAGLADLDQPSARAAFVAVEELFSRFEHLSALAQIALEDLQMALADIRECSGGEDRAPDEDWTERPSNILLFPGR